MATFGTINITADNETVLRAIYGNSFKDGNVTKGGIIQHDVNTFKDELNGLAEASTNYPDVKFKYSYDMEGYQGIMFNHDVQNGKISEEYELAKDEYESSAVKEVMAKAEALEPKDEDDFGMGYE